MEVLPTDSSTLRFAPVRLMEPFRRGGLMRLLQERRYGRLLADPITRFQPDVVVSANSPLDVQAAAFHAARSVGAATVFWVQDLHSVAIRRIIGRRSRWLGAAIGHRFVRLERRLLADSDWVIPTSHDFMPVLHGWGLGSDNVTVVENWAPLPSADSREGWEGGHNLPTGPRMLYAGTLALKHNPKLLLALARGVPEATVVVVSEGPGADWLIAHGADLPNLRVLPFQPFAQVDAMLASADILIAVLEADASLFSAPSKVQTYLAAGRPILAAMPSENLAAQTILHADAGMVVEPGEADQLVSTARRMLANDVQRGSWRSSARQYATDTFGIAKIADRFETILRHAVDRKSGYGT